MRRFHLDHLHFHTPFSSLLPHQLTRSAKELFASVGILGFAISAATLFEPIYLYTLKYSLSQIVVFYLIMYVLYFVLVPFGAKFVLRFGYEQGIALGSGILIIYYVALYGIGQFPMLFYIAPVICALHKMLYWMGYHGDFARSSDSLEVGKELGGVNFVISLVTIFGPVAGGAVAATFGFPALFLIVAILILISNIPLFRARIPVTRAAFPYFSAFKHITREPYKRRFIASLGYGEDFISLVFWPIFIFTVVAGAEKVGILITFSSLITAVILLYIGKLTDDKNPMSVLRGGVVVKVLTWIALIPVRLAGQYFVVDAVYRIARGATEYPLLTETYTAAKAADAMSVVVLYETGLIVGKILAMLALLVLFLTTWNPWTAAFATGAVFSILYIFYAHGSTATNRA